MYTHIQPHVIRTTHNAPHTNKFEAQGSAEWLLLGGGGGEGEGEGNTTAIHLNSIIIIIINIYAYHIGSRV